MESRNVLFHRRLFATSISQTSQKGEYLICYFDFPWRDVLKRCRKVNIKFNIWTFLRREDVWRCEKWKVINLRLTFHDVSGGARRGKLNNEFITFYFSRRVTQWRRRKSKVINSLFNFPWRQQLSTSQKVGFCDVFEDVAESVGYFNTEAFQKLTEEKEILREKGRKFEREKERRSHCVTPRTLR